MIQHAIILVNLAAFISGMATTPLLMWLSKRETGSFWRSGTYFHLATTLLMLSRILEQYFIVNFDFSRRYIEATPSIATFVLESIGFGLLPSTTKSIFILLTPLFCASLTKSRLSSHTRNIYMSLVLCNALLLFILTFPQHPFISPAIRTVIVAIQIMLMLSPLPFIVSAIRHPYEHRPPFKQIARWSKWLLVICLPGIFVDILWFPLQSQWDIIPDGLFVSSLLIGTWNILVLHPMLKELSAPPSKEASLDSFAKTYDLSSREKEIIKLLIKGYDNKKIAKTLFIELSTVKTHLRNIFQKTKVSKRLELVRKLWE